MFSLFSLPCRFFRFYSSLKCPVTTLLFMERLFLFSVWNSQLTQIASAATLWAKMRFEESQILKHTRFRSVLLFHVGS